MTERHPVCTCEDVLTQSRRTAVFAVVEVLCGGRALEVLHGQAVTQDVLLQVRTGPKLSITKIRINRKCFQGMMLSHFKSKNCIWFALLHNIRTKHSISCVYCKLGPMWGVGFLLSLFAIL